MENCPAPGSYNIKMIHRIAKITIVLFIGMHQQSEHCQVCYRYHKGNLKDKAEAE